MLISFFVTFVCQCQRHTDGKVYTLWKSLNKDACMQSSLNSLISGHGCFTVFFMIEHYYGFYISNSVHNIIMHPLKSLYQVCASVRCQSGHCPSNQLLSEFITVSPLPLKVWYPHNSENLTILYWIVGFPNLCSCVISVQLKPSLIMPPGDVSEIHSFI